MLYFVTMRQTGGLPEAAQGSFLLPSDGRLHFAVIYSAHPSSSKPFQYKIFCKHVDPAGNAVPGTPLYGLHGCELGFLDEGSLQKIAGVMHMFIRKASDGTMWYEYESHSMPDGSFCNVRNWALLMKNYSRFIDVNIGELEASLSESGRPVLKECKLNQTAKLVDAAPESGGPSKRRRQLHSTEVESLDDCDRHPEPTLTQLIDDSWLVPDGLFDGLESFDGI
jgi:hypothetical protein